jgi:hypothetical protein
MSDKNISVYIKINEKNEVIQIGSNIFISNFKDWIKIDEGKGDKYAHAQNYYLSKPLIDIKGKYNYIYKNGKIAEV